MNETITPASVREAVRDAVASIIDEYKDQPDTDRETVIERLDEECDALWGHLVCWGLIAEWDVDTLARHAGECAAIIKTAAEDAWVEDDDGLWDGLTYGVLPAVAYYSLRNLLYQALKDAGHDTNEDRPFATDNED
jgi:hypothetical protein